MRDIALKVPLVIQRNKFDCSIASLQMLLQYYGKDISYDELKSRLNIYVNKNERHIEASAILSAEEGFNVHFINHNKTVLGDTLQNLTEKDLAKFKSAYAECKEGNNEFKKTKIKLTIEFIKKGGHLSTAEPDFNLLTGALTIGNPIILCVKVSTLRSDADLKGNHYIVITGIQNKKLVINDPSPKYKSPYIMDMEIIISAWNQTDSYALWIEK